MTTALFIGRFQPFHKAHLEDVKNILKKHGRIIIGIGSSQESRTEKNPYTSEERQEMIQKTLVAQGIANYELVPISDINNDDFWVSHVESLVGKDYVQVYSGNELVIRLFKAAGKQVTTIDLIEDYSSTLIRRLMREGQPWEHLVPGEIVQYLKTIKFKNRKQESES